MPKLVEGHGKWTKRFTCHECHAVQEVYESDLYVANTAMAYAGETWDPEAYFDCAACHSRNNVTNNIPSGIQQRLFAELRDK